MGIFEFNSKILFGHILSIPAWKGVTDVFGANCFLPTHGLSAQTRIQKVCPEVPGQLPSPKIFLLQSISLYGLRSADLPRKSPRDRNMFARLAAQTLSRRDSEQSRSKYSRRSQRKQRLANLRRLCSNTDPKSKTTLCRRRVRCSFEPSRLCLRLDHDRPLSLAFPFSSFSKTQRCHQAPYSDGPPRQYLLFYPHHRRQCP